MHCYVVINYMGILIIVSKVSQILLRYICVYYCKILYYHTTNNSYTSHNIFSTLVLDIRNSTFSFRDMSQHIMCHNISCVTTWVSQSFLRSIISSYINSNLNNICDWMYKKRLYRHKK